MLWPRNESMFPDANPMKLLYLVTLSTAATFALRAADSAPAARPKPATFLTIESAGLDYAVQGEYFNDWGGAQVIALGEDKFRIVTYKGGLPGAGWDKETKTEAEGKREGDKIVF